LPKKAVIAAAGLGTRLLSATKEQPKEMLPLYTSNFQGHLSLKPMLQLIFEQIYDFGIRDFCFIVGRGKRAIEDHFTPDYYYEEILRNKKSRYLEESALDLERFHGKVKNSSIFWVNQSPNMGFGHAVLQAQSYVANEDFFVFAGDTLIISEGNNHHLKRLIDCYTRENADAAFLVQSVKDPENYGVVEGTSLSGVIEVKKVIEKPSVPDSDIAIMPIYIFKNDIFVHLGKLKPDHKNEIQLTDAIGSMLTNGKVVATEIRKDELRLDIGTPETYFKAQVESYNYAERRKNR
jgi:UTP--glucose-1-phosphate uridylyltransferase